MPGLAAGPHCTRTHSPQRTAQPGASRGGPDPDGHLAIENQPRASNTDPDRAGIPARSLPGPASRSRTLWIAIRIQQERQAALRGGARLIAPGLPGGWSAAPGAWAQVPGGWSAAPGASDHPGHARDLRMRTAATRGRGFGSRPKFREGRRAVAKVTCHSHSAEGAKYPLRR